MIKYNENSVLTGYIKESLHSFNLPLAKPFISEDLCYENGLYIKDNYIVQYHAGDFVKIMPYQYNKRIDNYTTVLRLNNNLYDSYTHEYLGEYLRFLKDYKGLDLTSLYNCFSNRLLSTFDVKFKASKKDFMMKKVTSAGELKENVLYYLNYRNDINLDDVKIPCTFINIAHSSGWIYPESIEIKKGSALNSADYFFRPENGKLYIANSPSPSSINPDELCIENLIHKMAGGEQVDQYIIRGGQITFALHPDFKTLNLPDEFIQNLYYEDISSDIDIEIKTDDNYKIYRLPVKFNKQYSIAIGSDSEVEIFCGFYNKGYFNIDSKNVKLEKLTYKNYNSLSFSKPILYNNLLDIDIDEYRQNENYLNMFIKLPVSNKSSIVVLEGNYLEENDFILDPSYITFATDIATRTEYSRKGAIMNSTALNFKKDKDGVEIDNDFSEGLPINTPMQLLAINSGNSHPFADRLVEYLCDNTITHLDPTSDNIKRVQVNLVNRPEGHAKLSRYKNSGIWERKYEAIIYDIIKEAQLTNKYWDHLGYVDKDVEKILGADPDIYSEE